MFITDCFYTVFFLAISEHLSAGFGMIVINRIACSWGRKLNLTRLLNTKKQSDYALLFFWLKITF